MTDVFSNNPGAVTVHSSRGIPMSFFLEGWGGFAGFRSIITGFHFNSRSGVQFMHTLRDFIYVYVFGERIGTVVVSGLSFHQSCGGSSCHGLENIIAYYSANRASTRAVPLVIVFGCSTVIFGLLTEIQAELKDPDKKVANFSLSFQSIPQGG